MKKRLIWLVPVILVLTIGLLALVAPLVIPADRTAALLADRVNAATGWNLELDSVKVRVWPHAGLKLGSGRMTGLPPDSGVEEAGWQGGALRFSLLPLLRGRLEAASATLDGVDCRGRNGDHAYTLAGGDLRLKDLALDLENETAAILPAAGPVRWELAASRLQWDAYPLENLDAEGWADADSLVAETWGAKLSGGSVSGRAAVALGAGAAIFPFRFALTVQDVPAAALLGDSAPDLAAHWEGNLAGSAAGWGTVRDGKLVPDSLELEGIAVGEEGIVHATEWLGDIASYLGKRQDLMEVRYDHLEHPLLVRDGRFAVDLQASGPDTDWRASGSIGLAGDLAVDIQVKLPAGFTPDLGSLFLLAASLRDKEGRLTLAAKLTGTTPQPRLVLDLDRTLQGTGADPGKALEKGLGGLLDKWKVR